MRLDFSCKSYYPEHAQEVFFFFDIMDLFNKDRLKKIILREQQLGVKVAGS